MVKKDEIMKQSISDDELEDVAGGGCWFGEKDEASDGHDIGCHLSCSWYDSWDEYHYKHNICKGCGGKLGEEQSVNSSYYKVCTECGYGNHNEW